MRSKKDAESEDHDANLRTDDESSDPGMSPGYVEAQQLLNAEHPGTQGGPTPNQPRPPEGKSAFCQKCGSPVAEKASLCSKCAAAGSEVQP